MQALDGTAEAESELLLALHDDLSVCDDQPLLPPSTLRLLAVMSASLVPPTHNPQPSPPTLEQNHTFYLLQEKRGRRNSLFAEMRTTLKDATL